MDGAPELVGIAAGVSIVSTTLFWLCVYAAVRIHASRPLQVQGEGGGKSQARALREPLTKFELGLARLDQLIYEVENRYLSRLLIGDVVDDLRCFILDMRTLNNTNILLDPVVRGAAQAEIVKDEFTSNWFNLGLGQSQYSMYDRQCQSEGQPEDSVSLSGEVEPTAVSRDSSRLSSSMRAGALQKRLGSSSTELVSWIRQSFDEWNFDIDHMRSLCASVGASPLVALLAALHTSRSDRSHSLAGILDVKDESVMAFAARVAGEYRQLPYHCEIHACDVLHAVTVMHRQICGTHVPRYEVAAIVLAAVVHDLGHPGVNNSFLMETFSPLAIRYNDVSVLENHHISLAFSIMLGYDRRSSDSQAGCMGDLLSNMDKQAYKRLRADVIALVLATSFENHFMHINNLKARAKTVAGTVLGGVEALDEKHEHEEHLILLKMLLKAADIGHPAKAWSWHLDSAKRACAEFFHQGKCEARAGLPVSPLNNAAECDLSKAQTGFLEFMVLPAFEALKLFVDLCPDSVAPTAASWVQIPIHHLEENASQWKKMDRSESEQIKSEIMQIDIADPFNAEWFSESQSDAGARRSSEPSSSSLRPGPVQSLKGAADEAEGKLTTRLNIANFLGARVGGRSPLRLNGRKQGVGVSGDVG